VIVDKIARLVFAQKPNKAQKERLVFAQKPNALNTRTVPTVNHQLCLYAIFRINLPNQ